MKSLTVTVILVLGSCGQTAGVENLITQLDCGMSLDEVRELTENEVKPTSTMPWLGSHRVDGQRADVWLSFDDEGLVSVIHGRTDGLTSVRLSPKKNLCTGELAFRLSLLLLTRDLVGAAVHVDGRRVATMDEIRRDVEVAGGSHELKVEMEGYDPLTLQLDFGRNDAGEQRLELKLADGRLVAQRP